MATARQPPAESDGATAIKGDVYGRVLEEAASLFRQRGYQGTSTRAIASAVGLQSASLYHYMDSKEDLLHQVCIDGWARMSGVFESALALDEPPLRALETAIREHLRTGLEHRDVYLTMLAESRALSPQRSADVLSARQRYVEGLHELVRRVQRDGSLRDDVPAPHVALLIRNLLAWTLFWYRPDGELDFDGLCELVIRVLLEGAYSAEHQTRQTDG